MFNVGFMKHLLYLIAKFQHLGASAYIHGEKIASTVKVYNPFNGTAHKRRSLMNEN